MSNNRVINVPQQTHNAIKFLNGPLLGISAIALGIGQRALTEALEYSKERKQFGKPIASFQAIQWKLADMATELDTFRLMLLRNGVRYDQGTLSSRDAAMTKIGASEAALRVTDEALQIFGGYGYTKEFPVERCFRDARICTLLLGTNDYQRQIISNSLISNL